MIKQAGIYWLANAFIWTWLLLPVAPLADLLKRDSSGAAIDHRTKTFAYFAICFCICVVWVLALPLWASFMTAVLNIKAEDVNEVALLVRTLLPFYCCYVANCMNDSVFYGKGRTELLALQSILTNVLVYGVAFALFEAGLFVPTLRSIALLFGTGIAVDCCITFGLYYGLLKELGYRL